ncbi:DUF3888 domain-containing protein [Ureibacillus sp. 179-F W5.1 NHS]|uniref:DUF3888 domain-containing protein n=1 Tax=Bacillales TaxID=1385 RepID=UPI001314AEEC|nr:DUF3888 domain-containing protein [Lysinibacillus halotolerans]
MKYKLIVILTLIVTFGLTEQNQAFSETSISEIAGNHTDFYDAFLALLDPYAEEAIRKKYPERSYALWDAEILEVTRKTAGYSQYDFNVKVKYDTYTGPFNPPEGFVILTFDVNIDGVKVIEFKE